MNKKLAMLAISAATGLCAQGAHAQSNVTIYGLVDAAVEYSSQGSGSLIRMQPGSYQGSRLGFRGNEDLGGGSSAFFIIESGFVADTGVAAQGGRMFGRQAFVGLKNGLGSLSIGRQYSPLYNALVQQDAFQYTMIGGIPALTITKPAGTTGALLGTWEAYGRVDNAIVYDSPDLAGVSAHLMYAPGEVAGSRAAGRLEGSHLRYNRGAVDVNVSWTNARDALDLGARTARTAGGSYDFGTVRLFAGYVKDSSNVASATGTRMPQSVVEIYDIGARFALTPHVTLVGQADRIHDDSEGLAASKDADAFNLGAEYGFSKRTIVYASAGTVSNQNGSGYSWGSGTALGGKVTGNPRARTANIGLRHTF
jgi:predicted porin